MSRAISNHHSPTSDKPRAVLYARYSSDLQDAKSIEDQLRVCRTLAESKGWQVTDTYTDRELSGKSLITRPGIRDLLSDGQDKRFDFVVSEALDRLSRDQADTATIYKLLKFEDVKIFTISEGEVNEMHVGFKGVMNEMFLEELRRKTHRGLEGRAIEGKSAGGRSYGYDVKKELLPDGTLSTGDREINELEAHIVVRIFRDYAAGKSPRRIAAELNAERVPGPSGNAWGSSTINGNRQRGTGILNNELYIGRQVWNKLRYVKNPKTGKRVSRLNPESAWVVADVPELRIVEQSLWDEVKAYQGKLDKKQSFAEKQRPPKLLSYLLKCGECGGGMSIVAQGRYGCSNARNKGTCSCRTTISQDALEEKVIGALRARLLNPDLTAVFCQEYANAMNQARKEQNASIDRYRRELAKVEKEMENVYQAILRGVDAQFIAGKARTLDERKAELEGLLDTTEEAPVFIHPNMGKRYAQAVDELLESLNSEEHRPKSSDIIRTLVEKIVLTPNADKSELVVDLFGDLAGILQVSEAALGGRGSQGFENLKTNERKEIEQIKTLSELDISGSGAGLAASKGKMVAGVGFEPTTFRL